jgi:hypothetical protein
LEDFASRAFDYLLELVRLEGQQSCQSLCICGEGKDVLYRCRHCNEARLFCKTCLVSRHEVRPLHNIEVCLLKLLSS